MCADQTRSQWFIEYLAANPRVSDLVFSDLSPAGLYRFGRTCRAVRHAAAAYISLEYDINKHLGRFFIDPIGFRSLQARTGALISGSQALQFFDGTYLAESDLDIYAEKRYSSEVGNWLIAAGYVFQDKSGSQTFEEAMVEVLESMAPPLPTQTAFLGLSNPEIFYSNRGIIRVLDFIKRSRNGVSLSESKVQLIVATVTPIETILNFHSTCVLNIISYERAYSLYPHATFEDRCSLAIARPKRQQREGHQKYALRGWSIIAELTPEDILKPSWSLQGRLRWIGDGQTWQISLDSTGVASPTSSDNLSAHSWCLYPSDYAEMSFSILSSPHLRYNYVVGHRVRSVYQEIVRSLEDSETDYLDTLLASRCKAILRDHEEDRDMAMRIQTLCSEAWLLHIN